jgi:hypothetical protein
MQDTRLKVMTTLCLGVTLSNLIQQFKFQKPINALVCGQSVIIFTFFMKEEYYV